MKKTALLCIAILLASCAPVYKTYVPAKEFVKDKGYKYLTIDTMSSGRDEKYLYIRYQYKSDLKKD